MASRPGQGEADDPRAITAYLAAVAPTLAEATSARRTLIQETGRFLMQAQTGEGTSWMRDAAKVGREVERPFRRLLGQLDGLHRPNACGMCHEALWLWAQTHVQACEALSQVTPAAGSARLKVAQHLIADGRRHGKRFNAHYTALKETIRQRVARRAPAASPS